MTSQNPTENDPKSVTNPAPKADKPTETKRELTDEETAAIAGGNTSVPPTTWKPPGTPPGGIHPG